MLVNSSGTPVYKVMFHRRLIRWKWDFKSATTGFIPDIIHILRKYDLFCHMYVLNNFIDNGKFPSRIQWKQIIIQSVRIVYEKNWRDTICIHLPLGIYAVVHHRCEAFKWWLLARRFPCYLEYVTARCGMDYVWFIYYRWKTSC